MSGRCRWRGARCWGATRGDPMNDPFWKRSGFGVCVLATCALFLRWWIDGLRPTTDAALEVIAFWLSLLGYSIARPTMAVPRDEGLAARVEAMIAAHVADQHGGKP